MRAVLDTSVLVGAEAGRIRPPDLPEQAFVSSVSLAELHLGVLAADDAGVRRTRLETLAFAERTFESLPVDDDVARAFARLVDRARRAGKRPPILDTLIAATALSHGLPLYTQDADFHDFADLDLIRI